ncbi:PREDICTED: small G protein signaling modulator 1 [Propithecus coquereli]|uniref:small G protein signaling modulator 1 n=1 Tax=Propithecus coquereli TaxID=379532 RepID=UPI00063FD077|nr:PREDICTED: small G protein signaling modulator 1 [Propithecus coquereli]
MEEAVTRKFVHEDSSHIISFCAAVEACVLHGLRRRAAGFLRSNKIAALFMKVGKSFPPAEDLSHKVQDLEQLIESARNQIQGLQENVRKLPKLPNLSPLAIKHLWIRTALFEKVLDKIVHYLVENSSKYYEKEALLMDPVDGPILASLLVGPCALEYTKIKTADHFWTDRDDMEAVPGYLSLHQMADVMTLKWTPNQLMNGSVGDLDYEKSVYWDYAMTIRLEEIVYLHCHQQVDSGGTVVLVSQDGIQRPPFRFPKGGHLLQFLSCLENGLLPHGQLDPPLWSQRGKTSHLTRSFCFVSQVAPDLLGSASPASVGPAWTMVPVGRSMLVVARGSQWARARWDATLPTPGLKEQPPIPQDLMDVSVSNLPSLWQPSPRKSSCSSCSQSGSADGSSTNGCNHERAPLKLLCDNMKYQILSRAFYGLECKPFGAAFQHQQDFPQAQSYEEQELLRLIYYGGIQPEIRKAVWPFLLGHYQFGMTETERKEIVRQRERESHAAALAKCSSGASLDSHLHRMMHRDSTISNESSQSCSSGHQNIRLHSDSSSSTQHNFSSGLSEHSEPSLSTEDSVLDAQRNVPPVRRPRGSSMDDRQSSEATTSQDEGPREELAVQDSLESDLLANESMDEFMSFTGSMDAALPEKDDAVMEGWRGSEAEKRSQVDSEDNLSEEPEMESLFPALASLAVTTSANNEVSPVSSSGVTYSPELLDLYTVNLHRIEKDVQRCDRNYWYFTPANLEKLRNIMCSYIWQHIEIGYVQGMCDLLAPLLVILDDEALAFSCFTELMKRMNQNFPHGGAMDTHFANMRSLIQILDSELFELMHQNGDYTHFYFCYRWFLLDFKRELIYDDVFSVWETIWAAKHVSSAHYVLFIALALVEVYRDIILENNMDFTDIIKFFNEMAERHNTKQVLKLARDLVYKVQTLIENK